MPIYANKSVEELRWEDYQAGCKGGPAAPVAPTPGGLFGAAQPAPGGFGAPTGGLSPFGPAPGTGAFGQPAAGAASSPFGAPAFGAAAQPSLYGAPPTGGTAFGAPPAPAGFSGFGAPAASAAPTPGAFGAPAAPSPFGGPAAPASTGFGFGGAGGAGGFGAAQPAGGGLFGQPAASAAPAGSLFGQPAPTPGAFGAAPTPGLGGFGAAPAPAFGAGGFGAASAAPAPGAFGAPPPGSAAPGAFSFGGASAFSAPAPAPVAGGLFGAAAPVTSGTGLFGQPAPAVGLFGGLSAAPTPGAGLFGAPAAAPPAAPGLGLFGAPGGAAPPPAGGLFGGFGASSQPLGALAAPAPPSLFGGLGLPLAAPPAGGLFGAPPPASSALAAPAPLFGGLGGFSTPQPSAAQPAPSLFAGFGGAGSSLFGASAPPPATPAPLFSAAGGLFGGYGAAPAQPAALAAQAAAAAGTAAVAAAAAAGPYGTLPPPPALDYGGGDTGPRLGLSARPPTASGGLPRAPALLAPRPGTSRLGLRLRPLGDLGGGGFANGGAGASPGPPAYGQQPPASTTTGGGGPGGSAGAAPSPGLLVPRDDPRAFFVRAPLPSATGPAPSAPAARVGSPSTSNGNHTSPPHPPAGGAGAVDASALAALPTPPTGDGAFMSPALAYLRAAVSARGPSALTAVRGFTVGVRGVGAVRWLVPVDVSGADLSSVVSIARGAVEVYPDEATKPDVGSGLNRTAEVTLLGVYKTDSATGAPTADPAAIQKFNRRLRSLAADQGATHLSYDVDGGVWKFKVDHFSKYGLVPDGESDDENGAGGAAAATAAAAPSPLKAAVDFRWGVPAEHPEVGREAGDAEIKAGGHQPAASLADWAAGAEEEGVEVVGLRTRGGGGRVFRGVVVAGGATPPSAAPALIDVDISDTSTLYGGAAAAAAAAAAAFPPLPTEGEEEAAAAAAAAADAAALFSPAAPTARYAPPLALLPLATAGRKRRCADSEPLALMGGANEVEAAAAAAAPSKNSPKKNVWRRLAPALDPPRRPGRDVMEGASAPALTPPPPTFGRPLPALPPPPSSPIARDLTVSLGGCAGAGSRVLVDAGALLGRTFRAGWGPGGLLAVPSFDGTRTTITLRRLPVGAPLLPPGRAAVPASVAAAGGRWASLWTRLAGVLAASSGPDGALGTVLPWEGERDDGSISLCTVPRWELVAPRGPPPGEVGVAQEGKQGGTLRALVCSVLATLGAHARTHPADPVSSAEALAVRSLAWAWELVDVLFTVEAREEEGRGGPTLGGQAGGRSPAAVSAASARRAALGRWLRDRAEPEVATALSALSAAPAAGVDPSHRAAWLLAGGQLAAGAAAAVGAGDARLAALIPAAASSTAARDAVARSLALWDAERMTGPASFAPGRELAYRLLAGDVAGVARPLSLAASAAQAAAAAPSPPADPPGLSWKVALGMHLWYGTAPGAAPAAALGAYEGDAEGGRAPPPLPPYAAPGAPPRAAPPPTASRAPAPSPDTCLRLLQLAARGARAGDGAALAALAAPAGLTPDPLDGFAGWALALAARAGSGCPPTPADVDDDAGVSGSGLAVERALHAGASAALEAVGAPEWAALPLLFLPGPATRASALRSLLSRHAPRWAADPAARAVLTGPLRLPPSWVAGALAEWARAARLRGDGQASEGVGAAVGAPPLQPAPGLGAEFWALASARDWPAAADVLATVYGPTLLAEKGSAGRAALKAALAALAPHAAAVDGSAGSGVWRSGAGLFEAFLAAEEAGSGRDAGVVGALADALVAAVAAQPLSDASGPGGVGAARVRRAALGDISAATAGWLLTGADDVAQSGALDLPALPADARIGHISAAAAALAEAAAA